MSKTFVAVRPGFQQAAIAAFGADMELVVDDTLQTDYEFRTRELGLADLLEAELETEERELARKSDPKNAHTIIVPLVSRDETLDEALDEPDRLKCLVVRIDRKEDRQAAVRVIQGESVVYSDDYLNERATINVLSTALKKADIKVYSISSSYGIACMKS